jgi:hypothetical protein
MKKRILLLVSVAALMSVMLVLSGVQAAFAANTDICPGPSWIITNEFVSPSANKNGNEFICENPGKNGTHYKDDHL